MVMGFTLKQVMLCSFGTTEAVAGITITMNLVPSETQFRPGMNIRPDLISSGRTQIHPEIQTPLYIPTGLKTT